MSENVVQRIENIVESTVVRNAPLLSTSASTMRAWALIGAGESLGAIEAEMMALVLDKGKRLTTNDVFGIIGRQRVALRKAQGL
jgi:hypothetical protein